MPTAELDAPAHSQARVIRKRNRPRMKLNESKVIELAELGVKQEDIAKNQSVAPVTVWRFLTQHKLRVQQIERFKSQRADLLAGLQGDCLELQTKIIRSIDDRVIGALKQGEKTGLVMALNATAGTCFDKERLERGESTANHSIVSTMVDNRVGRIYKPTPPPVVVNGKKTKQTSVTMRNDSEVTG